MRVINETKKIRDNRYLIKFNNTPDFNVLSEIHIDKKLVKGDSIYKPLFSNEILIYRKNEANKYELFHTNK
ncbi:hypothetical protein [Paenimyroides aestuarii]|uniref:Uncharacterized protein n=1 Tax=Paenimyroides aestuarii TaxID=2968490 RepID=A0ABY5NWG6_9FLAO|nr:hypothetical protein [Paenimyroides aestuarii]UUV22722.1 hypothetical protein NPX36_06690 [Paenimyroides aestuarii]